VVDRGLEILDPDRAHIAQGLIGLAHRKLCGVFPAFVGLGQNFDHFEHRHRTFPPWAGHAGTTCVDESARRYLDARQDLPRRTILRLTSARRRLEIARKKRVRRTMAYDPNNVFAKILRGEIPAHKLYEDDDTL